MRIAHLTDLHLRCHTPGHAAIPRRRSREALGLFEAALVDARERSADVVVVTGDVVDVPSYLFERERDVPSDTAIWAAVRRDYQLVRGLLDGSGMPWIALPGNHDAYAVQAEELGAGPFVRDLAGLRFVSFWDREGPHNVPRRTGKERMRFDEALVDPDRTPQVHLQHFVVTPELNEGYPHTYLEGDELRRRIVKSERVAMCLSGHYHPGSAPMTEGSTMFSVTPALVEAPHPYRLFDIALDPESGQVTNVEVEQISVRREGAARPAVFVDRDGCVNTLPAYRSGPESMELLRGAAAGLRALRAAGYVVVVVTNQSCVGLGYVTTETLNEVHDRMCALLADEGAGVDAIYASHQAGDRAIHPSLTGSIDAKPSPEMVRRAADELHLDLSRSFLVGDRESDVRAGIAAGVTPLLVRTGVGAATERGWGGRPECEVVDDLAAAAGRILQSRPITQV